jgi:isopentenyl-diphosphate delta-isomerase
MYRTEDDYRHKLAEAFTDWGAPTAEVIRNVVRSAPDIKIIASGGLRTGVDIAKCIALGASLGGMAGPFLKAAAQSADEAMKLINLIKTELDICMFATGSKSLAELRQHRLINK